MGTVNELLTNLNNAITTGKTNLANKGIDTTNIHTVYGVVKAIPDIQSAGEATLVAISVTPPATITYTQGDALDTTGMEVTGIYSDGTTSDITSSVTPPTTTLSTVGTQTITVTHTVDGTDFTDTFEVFVSEKSGIDWVNDKLIVTAADVENASTVTLDETTYVKVSDKDTLIRSEDSYMYTLGYIDQYSVDYSIYSSSTEESGYLNIIPFWNFYTQELKTSTNLIYHKIGLPTTAAVCYIIHTNGTVIGNQTLSKGLWIALDTTTNIPFTIFRTQATESLQDITIDPSTVYVSDNYHEITEFGGTDMPSQAIPTLKTYTGYKVSDNFLPIATGFIKSNSTSKISGDGSHVYHYYDSTNKKFGLCTYDNNGTTYPKIVSVSDDNTTIAISYGQYINTKYHKMITLPEKGTYIFCDTLTNITNDIVGLAIYADGTFNGDVPLGLTTDYIVAATTQDYTSISYYDYDGVPADSITLQNSTVLNTSRKGASFFVDAAQAFGSDLPVNIDGTNVSATGASLINDLIKDQQIGPYSYFYTCSQATDPTTKIFAYINDFYLSDGTFVRNPGVYTSLHNLHIKLDLNAQT